MIIFSNRGSELASIRNLRKNNYVTISDCVTIYDHKKHKPEVLPPIWLRCLGTQDLCHPKHVEMDPERRNLVPDDIELSSFDNEEWQSKDNCNVVTSSANTAEEESSIHSLEDGGTSKAKEMDKAVSSMSAFISYKQFLTIAFLMFSEIISQRSGEPNQNGSAEISSLSKA
jgi:hypothetical protein